MLQRLITRTLSICAAAMITLAMLGGIDHLAQPDETAPLFAQQSATGG
jgi:hypothetical protein